MATDLITYENQMVYFEGMAEKNKLIEHSNGPAGNGINSRRFFHSDIQDFANQAVNNLPSENDRCWMWLIDAIRTVETGKEELQIMFFIMNAVPNGDLVAEVAAKERVNQCVNQCVAKMIHDSQNNHPLWSRSLDQAKHIRITPYSFQDSTRHVGSQISIKSVQNWTKCYNQNDWNL
jgi:hypothetical protein